MTRPYADLLDLAVGAAAEAAELVLRMRTEGVDVAGEKSSPTDIVTRADHAAEDLLRTRLLSARPDDGFLGEEGDDLPGTSGLRWVVDPIDGTVNYLYGHRAYAVCVAVEQVDHDGADGTDGAGRVVAAVVHAPALGEVYTATLGGGAYCNGEPIAVRDVVPMEQRLIGTGFNYVREVRLAQAGYVARLLERVRDVRRGGSAALDLCSVAAGRLDGYAEEGTHPWDDAAAGLVAAEAGAEVAIWTSPAGNRLTVAAPKGDFSGFADVLAESGFVGNTAGNTSVH
ncbi:inositol monophosphatase [Nocardioides mangrovicus]|uniref:inositol-phosphate phosphatase n=1 Tax=Nocardioides mangrovicus TaxID=2478913 RepID=A0A3L8P2T0_9ACTN|nr:inositol monophosphatase family protein [Nocardioides mangrovicus]RLV49454.1 inositol monophosphatase [Nocardioides mangrovicus]